MEASIYKITEDNFKKAASFGTWEGTYTFLLDIGFRFANLIHNEGFHTNSFQSESKIVMIGARKCNFIIVEVSEENDYRGADKNITNYKKFYEKL